jgi:hypothetical protein
MIQNKIASYVLIVLTGMMVASLAAYFLLTTLGFSAKRLSGESPLPVSSMVVTGTVTTISQEASSTIFSVKTETGTTTIVLRAIGSHDCPAAQNIADIRLVAVGDILSVRGSQDGDSITPCQNGSDYLKVIKNEPLSATIATTSSNIYSNGLGKTATTTKAAPSSPISTTFKGVLQSVNTGCFADGECFVIVEGKHVTVLMLSRGMQQTAPVGIVEGVPSFGDLTSHVGATVEVRAALQSDGSYTLYGDPTYHIKLVQ